MKYPYKCSRCGMCCLMERCPIIMSLFRIEKKGRCPKIYFIDDEANCNLLNMVEPYEIEDNKKQFGIGDGCCIKARAYKDGIEYDFATLSSEMKVKVVQQIRREVK